MNKQYGRADLARIAAKAMVDRGLVAEFSTASLNQLAAFDGSHQESAPDFEIYAHCCGALLTTRNRGI